MDKRLRRLIAEYQKTVAARFEQLRVELAIDAPKSNTDWAGNGITQTGVLSNGARCFKHGYGCAIKYQGGSVDFDFGERGELTGSTRIASGTLRGHRILTTASHRRRKLPPR